MDTITTDMDAPDVDQREAVRFEGRVACSLDAGGGVWQCWLRDLSTGGAAVEPPMPALIGREVALTSADFPFGRPLPGRVVNVSHRRTGIAFDLPADLAQALRTFIEENS